ncbi:MAG: DegV family protein [Candidatus Caccosoma sp.]|nr:DegV family protein [Candidatus Caccosoma sp.]
MIKIITDSASDIMSEEAKKLDIEIIPMKINIDGIEYLDGVNITNLDFFKKLENCKEIPKTSQITPNEFINYFNKYKDAEIICITMSSKLSSTFQSAMYAKDKFSNVEVIDSENVSVGEALLVKLAVSLINQGKNYKEIINTLNEQKKRIRLIALLNTLDYLKNGGRISLAVAFVGGILGIKPVIEIKEGKVHFIGKARGSKQVNNMLRLKTNEGNGIDFNMPFMLGYSGLDDELLNKYIEDSKDIYPNNTKFDKVLIGSTIGSHIGLKAICIAYFENK